MYRTLFANLVSDKDINSSGVCIRLQVIVKMCNNRKKNMLNIINMPLVNSIIDDYDADGGLKEYCKKNNIDGIESIWGYEDQVAEDNLDMIQGWHLTFYCDWLDFWKQDEEALLTKFGSREAWESFYMCKDREGFLKMFADDLERAHRAKAKYVVFHVSDVSIEEGYTYEWLHSDEEVIDAAAEIINLLLDGKEYEFDFLVENLHWAGFTMAKPELTKRLLKQIHYPKKGIMLDTGHLMCTNLELKNEEEAIDYVLDCIKAHGDLASHIQGMHFHQSVTGQFVKENTGALPELPKDYFERFGFAYGHILQIDTHKPYTNYRAQEIVDLVKPKYLVHELASSSKSEKHEVTMKQMQTLGML